MTKPLVPVTPNIERIGGRLHRLTPLLDAAGKIVQYAVTPLRVELRMKDLIQILVGSTVLAIPIGFTEEVWVLAERLPTLNIILLAVLSLLFVSLYVYGNFYRSLLREHVFSYIKRVIAIYLLSFLVVGVLMTIIQQASWLVDPIVSLRRTILVTLPASMSAALSDSID